jgi:hypothetical protein
MAMLALSLALLGVGTASAASLRTLGRSRGASAEATAWMEGALATRAGVFAWWLLRRPKTRTQH